MAFDNGLISAIKEKVNIVDVISEYVQLTRRGKNYWGICPFHKDSKPSLAVTPDKRIYKCFVCGAAGDAIKFVQEYKKISFAEAIRLVGTKAGVDVSSVSDAPLKKTDPEVQAIVDVNREALNYFSYHLSESAPVEVADYVQKRGLSAEIRTAFGIGYAPKSGGLIDFLAAKGFVVADQFKAGLANETEGRFYETFRDRLIFTIKDKDGQPVGFSGRNIGEKGTAKYVNTAGTKAFKKSEVLYNYDRLKQLRKPELVYVLEGFMDVIALHKADVENAVATMGTAFTQQHLALLKAVTSKIRLCFDSDNAGRVAAVKSGETLFASGFTVDAVNKLPEKAKDVDELLNRFGKEMVRAALSDAVPYVAFRYDCALEGSDQNPDQAIAATREIADFLAKMPDRQRALTHAEWLEKHRPATAGQIVSAVSKAPQSREKAVVPSNAEPAVGLMKQRSLRHQLAEEQLLVMMLLHPEKTIPIFTKQLGYMNDPRHQLIADVVVGSFEEGSALTVAQAKERLDREESGLIDQLLAPGDPAIDAVDRAFSEQRVNDCIKIIRGVHKDRAIARLVEQNRNPDTAPKTKAENLSKLAELKKRGKQIG